MKCISLSGNIMKSRGEINDAQRSMQLNAILLIKTLE